MHIKFTSVQKNTIKFVLLGENYNYILHSTHTLAHKYSKSQSTRKIDFKRNCSSTENPIDSKYLLTLEYLYNMNK